MVFCLDFHQPAASTGYGIFASLSPRIERFSFLGNCGAVSLCLEVIHVNKTIEFMFAGINMFWARLRLILARAIRRAIWAIFSSLQAVLKEISDIKTCEIAGWQKS